MLLKILGWVYLKTPWGRSREIQKLLKELVEDTDAIKVVVVLSEDETHSSILYEESEEEIPPLKELWQERPMEKACKKILYLVIDKPWRAITLREPDFQGGLLKTVTSFTGIKNVQVIFLKKNSTESKILHLNIGFKTENISIRQKFHLQKSVPKLKNLL